MLDCWVPCAILLAFVRDFEWTVVGGVHVGCFGPVEKIPLCPYNNHQSLSSKFAQFSANHCIH
jgi:hypothetical protein